jgi:hypothetical protein
MFRRRSTGTVRPLVLVFCFSLRIGLNTFFVYADDAFAFSRLLDMSPSEVVAIANARPMVRALLSLDRYRRKRDIDQVAR